MDIVVEDQDPAVILQPCGRIDSGGSQELQQRLTELIEAGQRYLAVDFTQTESVSGAAMRVLFSAAKKLQGAGGFLVLCGMKQEVSKAFDLAEFSGRFSMAPGRAEAVAALATAAQLARAADRAAALLAGAEHRRDTKERSR